MSKELIKYKETIFSKLKSFIKNITSKEKEKKEIENIAHKKDFSEHIVARENKEEARLRRLKTSYDNREISEEKISDEDIDRLLEMYDKEIEELRKDTENIRRNIEGIIKVKK